MKRTHIFAPRSRWRSCSSSLSPQSAGTEGRAPKQPDPLFRQVLQVQETATEGAVNGISYSRIAGNARRSPDRLERQRAMNGGAKKPDAKGDDRPPRLRSFFVYYAKKGADPQRGR